MRVLGLICKFVLLLCARAVLIAAFLGSIAFAWGLYGYQRISCHPMFSPANIECGNEQQLAAEHAVILARSFVPYQQVLRDNQAELTVYVGVAVISSLVIELVFAVFAILRRRRGKRNLFKGATAVKAKQGSGPR